jgi:hypothetical protein
MNTETLPAAMNAKNPQAIKLVLTFTRVGLIGLFALAILAALHPDVRSEARGLFIRDYRTIVSTAKSDLFGAQSSVTIVKVKTREALALEIYEAAEDGTSRLIQKITLPDAKDGYFNFNGQATNLAVDDIDGDGRPEILAPSFDQNLVGRLNVYQFNPETKNFYRIVR